ncbi:MAG TPA: DUF4157 domain-containing protein, partial [Opitutaceae bacterium]
RFGCEFGRLSLFPPGPHRLQTKLAVNREGDAFEEEADRVSERVMRMTEPPGRGIGGKSEHPEKAHEPLQLRRVAAAGLAPTAAPPGVHEVLRAPGQPLDAATRAFMEPRFGHDFSRVRVHSGAAAESSARDVNALAYTVGHDIVFGAGQFAPRTHAGKGLLAHELAHVVQQSAPAERGSTRIGENQGLNSVVPIRRNGSGRLARKTLTDLPEATRKALKISRTAPLQPDLDGWVTAYFNPQSGTTRTAGVPVEFGVEITDANQQKGLGAIAAELLAVSSGNTGPETWPLPTGSILDLTLDQRPRGGDQAIYRFTHYAEGTAEKVLIEKKNVLAVATPAGGTPAVVPPQTGAAQSFTGPVTVGNVKVTIDAGFGNDRGKVIADAVQLLPDLIRAKIDGVTITYSGKGKGPDGENGNYDPMSDTVHLWGDLFDDSTRRVGSATNTAYQVVHELGHAIDLRPEFKAQLARGKAEEKKKDLEHQLQFPKINVDTGDPLAGLDGHDDPATVAEKARLRTEIANMEREITAQNAAMANAKSVAGGEVGTATESLLTDFGRALTGDGVTAVANAKTRNKAVDTANTQADAANKADPTGPQRPIRPHEKELSTGVSNYAATDLMEAFAENFSTYVLDEALLRALRPRTYAFFVSKFPKAAATHP